MGVEAWGVRRRARGVRVVQVGIGGYRRAGRRDDRDQRRLLRRPAAGPGPGTVVIATQRLGRDRGDARVRPGGRGAARARRTLARVPRRRRARSSPRPRMVTGAGRGDVGGSRPRGGRHGVGRRGRHGAALRHRPGDPRHAAARALAGLGEPGTRGPQPRQLERGALARRSTRPRYALRVGAVLQAAFLRDIHAEV